VVALRVTVIGLLLLDGFMLESLYKLGESLLPLHLGCGAAAVSYPSCSWRRGGEDAEIVCRQIQWLAGVSSHWCIVERMSSRLSGELLGGRRWSFSLRQIP
jgi:hypothetical protein